MHRYWFLNRKHSTSGMTILEVVVVVLIIGILSAIAAPSWIAFANRQRTNRATDQVLQAIRTAQAQAKRTRRTQSVTFDPNAAVPTVNNITLGEGDLDSAALSVMNGNGFDITEITFEATGGLDNDTDLPIHITVSVPDTSGAKKCVIIRSLLGSTQIGSDAECNS